MRYRSQIGKNSDIKFTGKKIKVEVNYSVALNNMLEGWERFSI